MSNPTTFMIPKGGGGSGESVKKIYTQTDHGFSVGNAVYRKTDGTWRKSKADADETSEVAGIVEVVDGNFFTLVEEGLISGLTGGVDGATGYLSATTAGAITVYEPDRTLYVSRALLTYTGTTTAIVNIQTGFRVGLATGSLTGFVNKVAGEALGGNRVTIVGDNGKAYYADRSILSHKSRVLGITKTAISQNATGDIQMFGPMTEVSWNWTMELPIFLSTNGLLTQTPPTSGFILEMGFPLSTTSMMIEKGIPIVLA